jgi:putative heme iron utilization protein
MTGIDVEGIDLASGDEARRVFFPAPLDDARNLRTVLVDLAREARAADRSQD